MTVADLTLNTASCLQFIQLLTAGFSHCPLLPPSGYTTANVLELGCFAALKLTSLLVCTST